MPRFYIPLFLLLVLSYPAMAARDVIAGPMTGDVMQVLDGDTVTVRVRIWIGQSIETSVRINGIDTPEMRGKCPREKQMAAAAQAELARLLHNGTIRLTNIHTGKYAGRIVADAETADGKNIRAHMIEKGLARPYGGEKRGAWCAV